MSDRKPAAADRITAPVSPSLMKDCVNTVCPWSGDPVQEDSLARYRGRIVGFCNTGCRDKFVRAAGTFDEMLSGS